MGGVKNVIVLGDEDTAVIPQHPVSGNNVIELGDEEPTASDNSIPEVTLSDQSTPNVEWNINNAKRFKSIVSPKGKDYYVPMATEIGHEKYTPVQRAIISGISDTFQNNKIYNRNVFEGEVNYRDTYFNSLEKSGKIKDLDVIKKGVYDELAHRKMKDSTVMKVVSEPYEAVKGGLVAATEAMPTTENIAKSFVESGSKGESAKEAIIGAGIRPLSKGIEAAFGLAGATPHGAAVYATLKALEIKAPEVNDAIMKALMPTHAIMGIDENSEEWKKGLANTADAAIGIFFYGLGGKFLKDKLKQKEYPKEWDKKPLPPDNPILPNSPDREAYERFKDNELTQENTTNSQAEQPIASVNPIESKQSDQNESTGTPETEVTKKTFNEWIAESVNAAKAMTPEQQVEISASLETPQITPILIERIEVENDLVNIKDATPNSPVVQALEQKRAELDAKIEQEHTATIENQTGADIKEHVTDFLLQDKEKLNESKSELKSDVAKEAVDNQIKEIDQIITPPEPPFRPHTELAEFHRELKTDMAKVDRKIIDKFKADINENSAIEFMKELERQGIIKVKGPCW